jgi:hypothetical protein
MAISEGQIMTKTKPQQLTRNALRQSSGANIAGAENVDVYQLLLAELKARRVRLQKLLHLVWMEAERLPARRVPAGSRTKCENVRVKRSA